MKNIFVFFVKKSDGFVLHPTCLTETSPDWTHSLTTFSHIWMYRRSFVVMLYDHWTAAELWLYTVTGPVVNLSLSFKSSRILITCCSVFTHLSTVPILASEELRTV